MSNINKIRLSGTTYDIEDLNAAKTVELTQAQYDALAVKDPNTFYIITDAEPVDMSDYYTKDEVDDLLDTKLDASAYTPTDLSNYYTKSETSGATQISTALALKADTATTYTKTEVDTALGAKQDTLTAGSGIGITNNVISVTGGSSVTVDTELDDTSENPVQNKVIYQKFDEVEEVTAAALNALNDKIGDINTLLEGI